MLALVESGLDRTTSYEIVQKAAMTTWDEGGDFRDLVRANEQVRAAVPEDQLNEIFDYSYFLEHVGHTFEKLGLSTKQLATN
jgi:adenylosuccinate lyase